MASPLRKDDYINTENNVFRLFQDKLPSQHGGLIDNGSGGSDDGGMWQQSVENRLTELSGRIGRLRDDMNRDFRWTWGGLVIGFIGMAALMAKGFGWLS